MPVRTGSCRRPSFVFVVCICCHGAGVAPSVSAQVPGELRTHPVDPAAPVRRVTVGGGGSVAESQSASVSERLAYSNPLGRLAAELPAAVWIADDLTVIAAEGCALRGFSFQVTGRPDPARCVGGLCGSFGVDFALYDACPGAGGQIISGTDGTVGFDDDGTYEVGVIVPTDTKIAVPSRVWLGLRMSRAHAGVVLGAPALTGFSGDVLDFIGFPCNASLGGFPAWPHASFNAEVYVDAICPTEFPGYQNIRTANFGLNPGTNVCMADDIRLRDRCDMVALEVGVRDWGLYDVELRVSVDGEPIGACRDQFDFGDHNIPGTWKRFFISQDGPAMRRFTFDPPIPLPNEKLWVVLTMNNEDAQWILTERNAAIGDTSATYAEYHSDEGWQLKLPTDSSHGGLHVVITCAGGPPVGACCDQYVRDEDNEAVCRVVPRINCPFPPWDPAWVEGASCNPEPFDHPCGLAACCKPDNTCENLTKNECNAVEPLAEPRVWDLGEFCDERGQSCPNMMCLLGEGDCFTARVGVGCSNPFCCDDVCSIDPWCCEVEWDRECVRSATERCVGDRPTNDSCSTEHAGAMLLAVNATAVFSSAFAESSHGEPAPECHLGVQPRCVGGSSHGRVCDYPGSCGQDGVCPERELTPGARPDATVWFKFVAESTSAKLSLCASDTDLDSIVQVFAVGDPTDDATACASLTTIGCSDDGLECFEHRCIDGKPGRGGPCQDTSRHASLCVKGLVPGDVYYVQVGSKTFDDRGVYQLEITSPCPVPGRPIRNDEPYCGSSRGLEPGLHAFDLARATKSAPNDVCADNIDRDVWFKAPEYWSYWHSVETCGYSADLTPDTTLIAYDDCECPPREESIVACSRDVGGACGLGSRVIVSRFQSGCLKIRLGDGAGESAAGILSVIPVERPKCPPMAIAREIAGFESEYGFVDPRRPHPADDAAALEGIDRVRVTVDDPTLGEEDVVFDASCWSVCETTHNVSLHPPYPPEFSANEVIEIRVIEPLEVYELVLRRPITPGEASTFVYTDANGRARAIHRATALPGDISGDGYTGAADLILMIDHNCWFSARPGWGDNCSSWPVWGWDALDINRSGRFDVTDLLELIDLLNGAGAYEPWMNASIPDGDAECP